MGVDALKDELVKQVVVALGQIEGLHFPAVKHHVDRSVHVSSRSAASPAARREEP